MRIQIMLMLLALFGAGFAGLAVAGSHVQNQMIVTIKPGGGVTTTPTVSVPAPHTPTFTLYSSKTVPINALSTTGTYVSVKSPQNVSILVWIPAGTYGWYAGQAWQNWNFTIATFTTAGLGTPPGTSSQSAQYGFAYEIDGKINSSDWFSTLSGSDVALTTTAHYPNTWTSYAWLNGTESANGKTYVNGAWGPENTWTYNATTGNLTNTQFTRPIMWVFTAGTAPVTVTALTQTVLTSTVSATVSTPVTPSTSSNTGLIIGAIIVIIIIIAIVLWLSMKGKK